MERHKTEKHWCKVIGKVKQVQSDLAGKAYGSEAQV